LGPPKPLAFQRLANERLGVPSLHVRTLEVALGFLEAAVKRRIDDRAFIRKTGLYHRTAREGLQCERLLMET
jgi:hypothetical protein